MNPFSYEPVNEVADAVRLGAVPGAKYLGGGTNLVDLMRETLERPASLVDVTALSTGIEETEAGAFASARGCGTLP